MDASCIMHAQVFIFPKNIWDRFDGKNSLYQRDAFGLTTMTEVRMGVIDGSHREISLEWIFEAWSSVCSAAWKLLVVEKEHISHSNGLVNGSSGSNSWVNSFRIFSRSFSTSLGVSLNGWNSLVIQTESREMIDEMNGIPMNQSRFYVIRLNL